MAAQQDQNSPPGTGCLQMAETLWALRPPKAWSLWCRTLRRRHLEVGGRHRGALGKGSWVSDLALPLPLPASWLP